MEEGTTGSPESTAAAAAPAPQAHTSEASPPSFFGDSTATETPDAPAADPAAQVEELTQEELEEIEHEGKKAKVPKEFKDAFMRHRDYTQKTQEVAEARKQVEAQYAEFQRTAQLNQATLEARAKLVANHQRLQQYKQLDWDAITKADPVQAMTLERQMRNLESESSQLAQGIAQTQQQMAFSEQQATARRIEEGRQQLARDIKGWSPELQTKLAEAATKDYAYRPEELAQVSDPRAIRILHDAYQYRQLMAKQAAKPPVAPLPKPVSKVTGSTATNTKALSDLSTEEWAAKRQERRNQPQRRTF